MTPQEQQMLQDLADRINKTQLPDKDADAEQFLEQSMGRNPDATYILAQTVLVQKYALEQAQKQLADTRAQIEQLRQQSAQPKHSTSFLGNLLGLNDEPARTPAPPPPPQYAQPQQYSQQQQQYAPVPNYAPAPGYASGYGAPQSGGFLRSAMQTATGVAAGALAFEGIESLMHGFGHSAGYGQGFGGGMGGGFGDSSRPEVVNNYYGDASPNQQSSQLSPDIEDRRDDSRFSDAAANNDHGDQGGGVDDTSGDPGDTSSSFDDGSNSGSDFDSGGGDSGGSDSSGGDFGGGGDSSGF